jgi:hypothetical protein
MFIPQMPTTAVGTANMAAQAAEAKTLTADHTVTMKAKMNHWVHAPVATIVQVSGRGPFQITYVDPKNDPRRK